MIQKKKYSPSAEQIIKHIGEAVLVFDSTTMEIISSNLIAEELLGYQTEELTGRSIAMLYENEDKYRHFHEQTIENLNSDKVFKNTIRLKRKNKSIFQARTTATDICNAENKREAIILIINDITKSDRQHLDKINRIIINANNLKQMLHNLFAELLMIFDSDRAFFLYPVDLNAKTYTVPMLQTKEEWPAGIDTDTNFPMDPTTLAAFKDILAINGSFCARQGSKHEVPSELAEVFGIKSILSIAIRPKNDKPWLLAMHQCSHARIWTHEERELFENISHRIADGLTSLLYMQELNRTKNYLSNIIDSMPSMLIGVDEKVVVTQWNLEAEKVTSIPQKEAIGKDLASLLPSMISEIDTIKQSIDKRVPQHKQNIKHETYGKDAHEEITVYPLVTNGMKGAVIRIDDVTEKIRLHKQLSHISKMDAIGQLAGGIAHDFNNMLSGIMGGAELLQLSLGNLDKKSSSYIDMILSSSRRAADLTAKLLAFGRKGKLLKSDIDINEIITDTVAILQKTIDKKITISKNCYALNSIITGDKTAIQNSLMNLGINASHAMENGGSLSIETKDTTLDKIYCDASPFEISPGNYIKIEIRDTGCGIPIENIGKIFEPFFTTKKHGKGTGLGLSSVFGTVQDHLGAINVYSEVGTGTVFHIFLPAIMGKIVPSQSTNEDVIAYGSGKIFLIDDEEIIRITGKKLLEEIGYDVILFENGLEAINAFAQLYSEIDVVITDMIMPQINGREVFYKLKEIDKKCKVVLSSGFTKDEDIDSLKKDGLSGYIRKPFGNIELSQLLKRVINKDT
jgi:PAS domain S-box-containing protein